MKLLWVICDVTSVIQFYSGVARVLLLHIMYRNDGAVSRGNRYFFVALFSKTAVQLLQHTTHRIQSPDFEW